MNVILDLAAPLALALLLLVTLLVVSMTLVARPWRSDRSGFADRVRIGATVLRYDFWLEMRGVGRRRCRDLREELRANLDDAAERIGTAQAVKALGSLRQMSAATATANGPARSPRWSTGANSAAGVLLVGALAELIAIASWTSAAEASGAGRVEGSLPLFPGSLASWERLDGGFSIGLEPGWLVIAAVAVAFVLGSRPWLADPRHHLSKNR